ncbi:hypothetical protein A2U01_0094750, partial [Trifolium medium]|nr:hypothetical protein [Trifolium medium]
MFQINALPGMKIHQVPKRTGPEASIVPHQSVQLLIRITLLLWVMCLVVLTPDILHMILVLQQSR